MNPKEICNYMYLGPMEMAQGHTLVHVGPLGANSGTLLGCPGNTGTRP